MPNGVRFFWLFLHKTRDKNVKIHIKKHYHSKNLHFKAKKVAFFEYICYNAQGLDKGGAQYAKQEKGNIWYGCFCGVVFGSNGDDHRM